MTTITQDINDLAGVDDNTSWTFYTEQIRLSGTGSAVVSTKKVRKYPVAGVLTVQLDPGLAVVVAPDGKKYPFTVPGADSQLWPLIQAAVTIPPTTQHQALLDAVDAWLVGHTNVWANIPDKPAVIAAGPTQAAARAAIGADRFQFLGNVASQAAMLALTGERGDYCNRTDLGDTFVLTDPTAPTLLVSWTSFAYPVTSVGGLIGAVTKTGLAINNVDNTSDVNKPVSTAQAAAIAAKLNTSAVVDNADGTVTVGSVTGLEPLPIASAVITANTAPAIGKTTYYSAMGGNLTPTLPALSGLSVGARFSLRRDPLDISNNTITFACAGGDTFYSSGATTFTLPIFGEQRDFQVVNDGGGKKWAPAGPLNPVAGNDLRYAAIALTPKPKVQVTDNCYALATSAFAAQAVTVGTLELRYVVGVSACDVQLVFGNYTESSSSPKIDTDGTTSITFGAAIKDASGNVYQVTFKGSKLCTLSPGSVVACDPLPIEVTKGQTIYARVFMSSGSFYINRSATTNTGDGGFTATTDLTLTGSGAVTSTFAFAFAPSAIIGTPLATVGTPKAVIVQGDSLAAGTGDSKSPQNGYYPTTPYMCGGGYLLRALSSNAGVISVALPSDKVNDFLPNNGHFRRASFTQYAKYAVIEYGVNDISGGRTAAQVQQDLLTQATRNLARGIVKNIIVTITPETTTTDRWATTGNQTVSSSSGETQRIAHNTWVRAGGPIDPTTLAPVAVGTSGALLFGQGLHPIGGYIEVADVVESARNSGIWKAALRVVTDAAITSGSAILTSATAAFTSADVGRDVVIAGAGAAAADLKAIITVINTSTSVNVTVAAGTTVSAATAVIGPNTYDGIHPDTIGHAAIAAAIQTPLLALLT